MYIFFKDMLILAAMGPPGGGRNKITDRLLTRFAVVNLTFPDDDQLERIYSLMLTQHLQQFDRQIQAVGKYHSTQYKPFTSPLFFLG
jgi:dynein heavy chain